MMSFMMRRSLVIAAFAICVVSQASAQWLEPTPMFPAPVYHGTNPVSFSVPAVQISSLHMRVLNGRVPLPGPGTFVDSFFDIFVDLELNSGGNSGPAVLSGHATARAQGGAGTFDTEMLSMDLSGNSPIGPIMIRESPTRASLGRTTATQSANGFMMDSFFDVFFDLSIDGGQTWGPSNEPMRLNGVPEPASMAVLGLGLAAVVAKRRKRS